MIQFTVTCSPNSRAVKYMNVDAIPYVPDMLDKYEALHEFAHRAEPDLHDRVSSIGDAVVARAADEENQWLVEEFLQDLNGDGELPNEDPPRFGLN